MRNVQIEEMINREFLVFSFGDRNRDQVLGINRDWLDRIQLDESWRAAKRLYWNLSDFLKERFPGQDPVRLKRVCDLKMQPIREKLELLERKISEYQTLISARSRRD